MTDYMILINKENKVTEDFLKSIELVEAQNAEGKLCRLEKESLRMYYQLEKLCQEKGIQIAIDSAYRSVEEQQEIFDDFCQRYGKDYAEQTVAPVGTSEYHSGLAVDLTISLDGGKTYLSENADLIKNEDIFKEIHADLSKFGFIIRYPKNKESITGYNYEPWHVRFVGIENAEKIAQSGLTLEEYKEISS